jgi:hypothetical protein
VGIRRALIDVDTREHRVLDCTDRQQCSVVSFRHREAHLRARLRQQADRPRLLEDDRRLDAVGAALEDKGDALVTFEDGFDSLTTGGSGFDPRFATVDSLLEGEIPAGERCRPPCRSFGQGWMDRDRRRLVLAHRRVLWAQGNGSSGSGRFFESRGD